MSSLGYEHFTENKVTTPLEYLLMSMAVYTDLKSEAGDDHPDLSKDVSHVDIFNKSDVASDGATKITEEDRQTKAYQMLQNMGWELSSFDYGKDADGSDTGYRGAVFKHATRHELCLAHRGTEVTLGLDSVMADLKAVVMGQKDHPFTTSGLASTFVNLKAQEGLLGDEFKSWKVSTTGHSLGGFIAGLLAYVLERHGMSDVHVDHVISRVFEAPGFYDYINALEPKDEAYRVNPSSMDSVNYLGRPDLVNTVNYNACTIVNLDQAEAKGHEGDGGFKGITELMDIHSKSRLATRLSAVDGHPLASEAVMMAQWPHTSGDLAQKAFKILSGDVSTIVTAAASATGKIVGTTGSALATAGAAVVSGVKRVSSGVSSIFKAVKRALVGDDAAKEAAEAAAEAVLAAEVEALSDEAKKAIFAELQTALDTGYVALDKVDYHSRIHMRHFASHFKSFLRAARFIKHAPLVAEQFFNELDQVPSSDLLEALKNLEIDGDDFITLGSSSIGVHQFQEKLEAYVKSDPKCLDVSEFMGIFIDGMVQFKGKFEESLKANEAQRSEYDALLADAKQFRDEIKKMQREQVVLTEVNAKGEAIVAANMVGDIESRLKKAVSQAKQDHVDLILKRVNAEGKAVVLADDLDLGRSMTFKEVKEYTAFQSMQLMKMQQVRDGRLTMTQAFGVEFTSSLDDTGSGAGAGAGAGGGSDSAGLDPK